MTTRQDARGVVRVSVASASRRVDLLLPGWVPLTDLVPELARSVGLLDRASCHEGYRLVTTAGRVLDDQVGLLAQGVVDGTLLTVTSAAVGSPKVYDDVVEAMSDLVLAEAGRWPPGGARRTTLAIASLLMALGGVALSTLTSSRAAGGTGVLTAALLGAGAVATSRLRAQPRTAVVGASLACGFASCAAAVTALGSGRPSTDALLVWSGTGALVAGLVCLVGLGEGRTLMLPWVVAGAAALAAGLVGQASGIETNVLLTVLVVLVVLAGAAGPGLALSSAGPDPVEIGMPVDREQLAEDVRVAHQILVAISVTVGALLVLIAPLAVSLGPAGTLVAAASSVVVLLRSRRYHSGGLALVSLWSGTLGLASTGIGVVWVHPDWRPTTVALLLACGGLLLAATGLNGGFNGRRAHRLRRLADVGETVCLLALLPLLVLATGAFTAIRIR